MKGDFTRDTFDPAKHYRDVLLQQGRAQVDADWNEQAELTARRDETTTADIAGHCGGPADRAAFGVITAIANLSPIEQQHLKDLKISPLAQGDFILSAGRYYVDGIQCENEWALPFTAQPDRLDVTPLANNKTYLLYLDVWQRHITALEDGSIRESALGGPDTATRVKTICQVRALDISASIDPNNPCNRGSADFKKLFDPGTAMLTADTAKIPTPKDPCLVPPSAGFTGLENQLYRVEIHNPTTWKWSRENGSVVTRIEKIEGQKITVASLGPDKNLGFLKDAWVEILDDALELESNPGQLAQIDDVDEATRIITLRSAVAISSLVPPDPVKFPSLSYPNGVVPERSPKLRRWEGVVTPLQLGTKLPLESGIEVTFAAKGSYRTGHYWQIPARTATAQSPNGEIEWPVDKNNRLALAPRGITHHFCRLGIVTVPNTGPVDAIDCRCLWPALTQVPRLFYVSGDGQEVMPDLTDTTPKRYYKLPEPLIVGLGNGQCAPEGAKVRFTVALGDGGLTLTTGGLPAPTIEVPIGADGSAPCNFHLDGNYPAHYSQRAEAQLLDAAGAPCSLKIIFNATLSVAHEVAYDPGTCAALKGRKNVQDAISSLAALVRIDKMGGDGQDTEPGQPVPNELVVLVSNKCGPVKDATVTFTAADGFVAGKLADIPSSKLRTIDVKTDGNGIAQCFWRTDLTPTTQQLLAEITAALPVGLALEARHSVLFTANLRVQGGEGPACDVAVGKEGRFKTLEEAIKALLDKKQQQICICLLPGDHEVGELVLQLKGQTVHLHISGCGLGHRVLLNKAMAFTGFASVHFRDFSILTKDGRLLFEQCQNVELSGCSLSGVTGKNPLIQISNADHIKVADTRIETQRLDGRPVKVLGSRAGLADLFQIPDAGEFRDRAILQANELAELSGPARKSFVAQARGFLRTSGPSPDEVVVFEKFFTAVATADAASTAALAESLRGIRDITLRAGNGLALVISGENAITILEDNEIAGTVSFYGIPLEGGEISDSLRKLLAVAIVGQAVVLVDSPGVLQMHRNSVSRVVFGKAMLDQLTIAPNTGVVVQIPVYQTYFLSHNVIQEGLNLFLANHLSFTANRFRGHDPLGTALSQSAAYVGNSALNDFRLFDISDNFDKAANILINIVHNG
jgi:hypothetical protein